MNYNKIELSIIIVTYNSASYILECIKSIYNNTSTIFEIIIIDNNSTDNTISLINNSFEKDNIRIVENVYNEGFSRACNTGARISNGEYLLFCNPDTIIINNIFSIIKPFMDENIGCISPQILDWNSQEAAFAFRFPHSPTKLIFVFFRSIINKLNPQILQINYINKNNVIECDWVLGASMICKRDIFFSVKGFDESFFLYFEDVDICKKIKKKGYKNLAIRDAKVMHKKYGSWESIKNPEFNLIRFKSKGIYYKKYYNYWGKFISSVLDKKTILFRS